MTRFSLSFLFVAIAAMVLFASCSKKPAAPVVVENEGDKPSITVTNTSVVTLTADQVSFDVTIRERGQNVDKLTDDGNIRSNKVKEVLKRLGIESTPTRQFSVTPYYSYTIIDKNGNLYDRDNERREYKYHEYLHTFAVKFEHADKNPELVGQAIDAILAVDSAEIGNVTFGITDNRKANAAVRKASAQAVMRKINSYAEGCGVAVKGIRNMHEGAYTRDTGMVMAKASGVTANRYAAAAPMMDMVEEAKMMDDDSSTQITSDKISVNAEVNYTAILAGNAKSRLNVRGFAEIKATPDVAEFIVTARISGYNTSQLVRDGSKIIKGLCDRLNGECEMTTVQYSILPYFVSEKNESQIYHSDRANILNQFEFIHSVRIKVMNFDEGNKLGKVIDSVKKNADERISIGGVSYSISDNTKYSDEARSGAAANGKEKCEIYADGAGTDASGVFSIIENYSAQDTDIDGDGLYYGSQGKKIYKGSDIAENQTVIFRDKVSVRSQLTVTADI
ncbi:MAG TPA: hypothetical protein DCO86_05270 [Spirochaetaceae bacterium]|nr:hypothetical protein [Spirochaetaceae bacterium]